MPVLRLEESAKVELVNYRWPGNIRQLKNITEQISIIEQNRIIDNETLKKYLPIETSSLPTLYKSGGVDEKTFESEREMLYKLLFDMKGEMSDLKKVVFDLMKNNQLRSNFNTSSLEKQEEVVDDFELIRQENSIKKQPVGFSPEDLRNAEDTEEFIEESLSIESKEKELIFKALAKHNGKRKFAAEDLGISERTLYRKIKEYKIEQ
jgi:transcriptional regulator with PAS, ATPase and Fis domain